VQQKLIETNRQKYGADHYLASIIARQKIEATNIQKYGTKVAAPWGSEAHKQSLLAKYGIENIRDNPDVHNKIIRAQIMTNISNGSTEASIIACQSRRNVECQNVELALDPNRPKLEDTPLIWKHKICGTEYTSAIIDGDIKACPKCHNGASVLELSLRSMICEMLPNEEVLFKVKGILPRNQEYDIYIPSRKIAIEFNGIYWHSASRDPNRIKHLQKTEESEKLGIKLIHVWEHDFLQRTEIVKSILNNILGKSKKIGARRCTVRNIDANVAKTFTKQNHIDGSIGGKIHLGLFYKDELVSVMSFGTRRFKKEDSWEIYRLCSKTGYQIQGGASKLFNYFITNYKPSKVITFCDRSLGGGEVYKKIGMAEVESTPPSYFWANINTAESLSRFKTQKHKLHKLLPNFDPQLSESENMKRAGWFKIWDCGNRVFVWES
jgi:hypothetical protein